MSSTIMNNISCKYLVVKYVEDDVRDEPINVGIILQPQGSYEIVSKFITQYTRYRIGDLHQSSKTILESTLSRLQDQIGHISKDEETLDKIIVNFQGKLKFTEVRGTLASDVNDEINYLFRRYMSAGAQDEYTRMTSEKMIKDILESIYKYSNIDIRRQYILHGKKSEFNYDLAIFGRVVKYLYAISFDEREALNKIKLFDWSVKDTIEEHTDLSLNNFVPVLAEPSPKSPAYEKVLERFTSAVSILTTLNYPVMMYNTGQAWRKGLEALVTK
jgi:hypothetical protein